jgi:hypothetical protein
MKTEGSLSLKPSTDFIYTGGESNTGSYKNKKKFFNFKNIDALTKQLTIFQKLPKNEQADILVKELEEEAPRKISTRKIKPEKKLNEGFFNKAKAIHKNFKEASVIWPKIKPEILNNAIDLDYIFKNIINK